MKFNKDNWEDIKKYFDKSYMKFPLLGDEVVYVESVSSAGMSGKRMQNADWDGWQFTFGGANTSAEVEFVLPRKSYFECGGYAYLLTRQPTKQYKRGICRENTEISMLTMEGFQNVPLSLELINAYTHKPSFQGFRDELGSSYAVSRRIAVDQTGKIYVDRTRIGYVDVKRRSINCNIELFVPELEHIVRENGQTFTVVCQKKPRQQRRREELMKKKTSSKPEEESPNGEFQILNELFPEEIL